MKTAIIEFKNHLVEMVKEERTTIKNRNEKADNLLSVLLRTSETDGEGRNALSDEEVIGNLFIYSFAGHDTTANTLAYAITELSVNSKHQEWIGEELDGVFKGRESVEDWEYEQAFPKLRRCLALMASSANLDLALYY